MRWRPLAAAVAGAVVAAATAGVGLERGWWRFNHPDGMRFPLRGIDVSHYQGKIDWPAVARDAEIAFVYVKATEGGDWVDPRFADNWREARRTGLRVGAYHFFTFCCPPLDQANHFLTLLPTDSDGLPPVVDVEFGGNCRLQRPPEELRRDLETWIQMVEAQTSRKVIVYATHEAVETFLDLSPFANPVWIRDIWREPELGRGRPWVFWQFANRGRVTGIAGFVDLNVFSGDRAALNAL